MNPEYRNQIKKEFESCVTQTIDRFKNGKGTFRPFHSALLTDEVIFWSRFERSFSTSFGQRVVEEIARILALSNQAEDAQRQKVTEIILDEALVHAVDRHIQLVRDNKNTLTSWQDVLNFLNSVTLSGQTTSLRIISDLWWSRNGVDYFASLKTVKPNIDQTATAKRDCLLLKLYNPECNVYFGLPYNPFGNDKTSYEHNPPMKLFNFTTDPVVLIGEELWDTIGGSGSYNELLSIATEVGIETKVLLQKLRPAAGN